MRSIAYLVEISGYNGDNRLFNFCDGVDNKQLAIDYANNKKKQIKTLGLSFDGITVTCYLDRKVVYELKNDDTPCIEAITPRKAKEIIDSRTPLGLFYTQEDGVFLSVSNEDGHAYVNEFKDFEPCRKYLLFGEYDDSRLA